MHLITFKLVSSSLGCIQLCTEKTIHFRWWQCCFHSDKILTGSFDKTARLWSAETGECYNILWGHTAEVVTVQFNPHSLLVGTSSMDSTARLYHIATGWFHMIFPLLQCFSLVHVHVICDKTTSAHHSQSVNVVHKFNFFSTQMFLLDTSNSPFLACFVLLSSNYYHHKDWNLHRRYILSLGEFFP